MANFDHKVFSVEQSMKELQKDIKDLTKQMADKAKRDVEILAGTAHSMILKKANSKLKSTLQMYTDNLDIKKIAGSGDTVTHAVILYKPAKWIEDGQEAHNMIDMLLGSKAITKSGKNAGQSWVKHGKKGRYAVVPFEHSKSSNQQSAKQSKITEYMNKELEARGLDKVITRDGKPVLGKAATVDLIARGSPQSEKSFRPLLSGLTIYQSLKLSKTGAVMKNKKGEPRVRRDIFTFRIVSDSQKGKGLWDHPGSPGLKAFEQVAKDLDPIWESMMRELVK